MFVNARYEKVRAGSRVVSQGILLVSAVRDDGLQKSSGRKLRARRARRPTKSFPVAEERSLKSRGRQPARGDGRIVLPGGETVDFQALAVVLVTEHVN